jgi:hypothetical protein
MSNDIMLLDAHITLPIRRGLRPIIRLGQHQSNASHNVSIGAATHHHNWFSGGMRYQGRSADNKKMRGLRQLGFEGLATTLASAETPLPAALPLFAAGLSGLGLLGWRCF